MGDYNTEEAIIHALRFVYSEENNWNDIEIIEVIQHDFIDNEWYCKIKVTNKTTNHVLDLVVNTDKLDPNHYIYEDPRESVPCSAIKEYKRSVVLGC